MRRREGDHRRMDITLRLAQQPEADELLSRSPLAAMTGMLLDQQVREVSEDMSVSGLYSNRFSNERTSR